jgi:glucokinase
MEPPVDPRSPLYGGADDFVLGIDFGGTKIALATADGAGAILESDRLDTQAADGAAQALDRAVTRAQELLTTSGKAAGGRCLAVGAVSPGIVLPDRVLLAPNVPGWGDLALARQLRERLGLARAEVGTDVKAAALAETRWGTLRGVDPGVLISLGTGIAAAIVVKGAVLGGANGAAGEIGYSLRGRGDETGAAHGRAPLEEFVGGRAIGERASRAFGEELTAADVFARGDLQAQFLVHETLAELSVNVANLAIAVDPEKIAVGGGLMSHQDLTLAALDHRLRFAVPFPPDVVAARFVHDGPLRGAIALALDAAARPAQAPADGPLAGLPEAV